jgi:hypothetical protein
MPARSSSSRRRSASAGRRSTSPLTQPPLNDLQRRARRQRGGRYSRGLPRRGDARTRLGQLHRVGPKRSAAQINAVNTMPAVDRRRPRRSPEGLPARQGPPRPARAHRRAPSRAQPHPDRGGCRCSRRLTPHPLRTGAEDLQRSGHPPGIGRAEVGERPAGGLRARGTISCSASRTGPRRADDHGRICGAGATAAPAARSRECGSAAFRTSTGRCRETRRTK